MEGGAEDFQPFSIESETLPENADASIKSSLSERKKDTLSGGKSSWETLASLYPMFSGSFDEAISAASMQNKWLMVMVHAKEFSSHLLNQETWANEAVHQNITGKFIFWQVFDETADGKEVCTSYKLDQIPEVLIIDPITGQKKWSWREMSQPESLLEVCQLLQVLLEFSRAGPKDHDNICSPKHVGESSTKPNIKAEKNPESVGDSLSEEEFRSMVKPLPKPQLIDLLCNARAHNPSITEEVKNIASVDAGHRTLFVRNLSLKTNAQALHTVFDKYGKTESVYVIYDKLGKSRGYGFIVYEDVKSAQDALKKPLKFIEGRSATCHLACEGARTSSSAHDLPKKLFIGNLPKTVTSEMLLLCFETYGEIEEGSITYDKLSDESRGFGFITYKTVEATQKAINMLNNKSLWGQNIVVRYAASHKRVGGRTHDASDERGGGLPHATKHEGFNEGGGVPPHDPAHEGGAGQPHAPAHEGGAGQPPFPVVVVPLTVYASGPTTVAYGQFPYYYYYDYPHDQFWYYQE